MDQRPALGAALKLEVQAVIERISDLPYSGSPAEDTLRRTHLPRFPFSIVYRLTDGEIEIVAVVHQRRRPGYWRERT